MTTRDDDAMLEGPTGSLIEKSVKRIALCLGVVAIALGLTFCFVASSLCITITASVFFAILVDPLVVRLEKLHVHRSLASAAVILSLMLLVGLIAYGVYLQANAFAEQLPSYSYRIRGALHPVVAKFEHVKKNAESISSPNPPKRVPEVKVDGMPDWPSYIVRGVGSISGALVIVAVVPFLAFFMLTKKEHLRSRCTSIVGKRIDLQEFIYRLDRMIRGFVFGNLIVGSIMAGAASLTFVLLGMRNALVLGVIVAALNLIPFLGLSLALVVAFAAALVQFKTIAPFVVILLVLLILHILVANMLIPRLVGSRVSVSPVAVTVGMLFWGWLWGVFGVLLAVPLTAFVKLVADCHPSLVQLSSILSASDSTPACNAGAGKSKPDRLPAEPESQRQGATDDDRTSVGRGRSATNQRDRSLASPA